MLLPLGYRGSDDRDKESIGGKQMREEIKSTEDILAMLDGLLEEKRLFSWDRFYENRERNVPFFENKPDENLAAYVSGQTVPAGGKALDLGCGPGRNAIFLSRCGFSVDALDSSAQALAWAAERAEECGESIRFIGQSLFDFHPPRDTYDFVYDSGCLHHIAPHRRPDYLELVRTALKPGGMFGLTCFKELGELGGAAISDWQIYQDMNLHGGLGFTEEKLRSIFHDYECVDIRDMREADDTESVFGVNGMLTALFRKNEY